ncbi:hypothetical protein [Bacillus sp. OK048]|nr:hypothetical protein [Bacillus sp. OK048]SDN63632.1 hypothetical protein SAMN05443253_11568 [Bacillus sp. OK048]
MTHVNNQRPQITSYTTKKFLAEIRMEENTKDAKRLKEINERIKKLKKDE